MDKIERYERYKYLTGLSSWEISSYKDKDFVIFVNDGPCGLRKPICQEFTNQSEVYTSVCMPAPSALAASFDKKLCFDNATILAKECLLHKTNILLAPGVNIKRYVLCGRNFEYFSEDPFLAGVLAANYVNGLEYSGVGACVKHYAVNSQEYARKINSSEVSLRALNEIYLRVFKYTLKYSNPTSIMTSYNKVNGVYINEDPYLIQTKLRKEFNFSGLIMSDWGAVSNKWIGIKNGLNVEMPKTNMSNDFIDSGYDNIFNDQDLIKRDNETYNAISKFKNTKYIDELDLDNLHEESAKIAKKTMVLVKNNDNYLPFNKKDKVLVLGHIAKNACYVGGGSAWVKAYKVPSFIDILTENNINYDFIECYDADNVLIDENTLRLYKNKYDKVVLFMGLYQNKDCEGSDRHTLNLCSNQLKVLEYVKNVFANFATVISTGSVVNIEDVYKYSSAVMIAYLAGEGQSEAIFSNLFGFNNPSGRLPETWISSLTQNPIIKECLRKDAYHTYYYDDIYVGYRYYDSNKVDGFILPFGYGLSYSKFEYSNFKINGNNDSVLISLDVKNISLVDGEDVIQVYVEKVNSNIYRAKKELKGFEKIFVKANETNTLTIKIDIDDIKSYREETDKFELEDGDYLFHIALNVNEVINTLSVNLKGVIFEKITEPRKLIHKEILNYYTFDTPCGSFFHNDLFKNYVVSNNLPFEIENFEEKYAFMASEPIRSLPTYFPITFEQLELLINYLNDNNTDNRLSEIINYER